MSLMIYKYLQGPYAEAFVFKGEVLFSSLARFRVYEHKERGDRLEGDRRFAPLGGLPVTKWGATSFVMPEWSFQAKAKERDIFILSTSLTLSLDLASEFQTDACIEIFDIEMFVARLRTGLRRNPRAKVRTLIHDQVVYYATEQPPEEVWALPARIVMHKHRDFAHQHEYRFAFGTKANVFDFQNADYALVRDVTGVATALNERECPRMKLRLGPMEDCCRLVSGLDIAQTA
jgi:hypothetical protein